MSSEEIMELRERIEDIENLLRTLVRYPHPDYCGEWLPVVSADPEAWENFGRGS